MTASSSSPLPRTPIVVLLLVVCYSFLASFTQVEKEPVKWSIRDQRVLKWIAGTYEVYKGKPMPVGMPERILTAVRHSCQKHVGWKRWGLLENVELAKHYQESRFDWEAVGLYDNLPPDKRSEGVAQMRRDVAQEILHRPVGERELLDNVELNINLGVQHLLWMRTLQKYNAGPGGARKGYGMRYSLTVKKTLRGLSWRVKKSKEEVDEKLYFGLFAVHSGKLGGVEPGKRLRAPGEGSRVGKGGKRGRAHR